MDKPKAKKRTRKPRQVIECVETIPPACPRCGCTDRNHKESTKRLQITGVSATGTSYTAIQWNYTNCRGCGQRYSFRELLKPVDKSETM